MGIIFTTHQQHDQILASLYKIHAIPGTIVDPQGHVRSSFCDRSHAAL